MDLTTARITHRQILDCAAALMVDGEFADDAARATFDGLLDEADQLKARFGSAWGELEPDSDLEPARALTCLERQQRDGQRCVGHKGDDRTDYRALFRKARSTQSAGVVSPCCTHRLWVASMLPSERSPQTG